MESGSDLSSTPRVQLRKILYGLYRNLESSHNELADIDQLSHGELKAATRRLRDYRIHSRLHATNIDSLVEGLGITSNALRSLKNGGVSNASDVIERGVHGLAQFPNVGNKTAGKIADAAEGVARPRLGDYRIPVSRDLWDGADEVVARALNFWHRVAETWKSQPGRNLHDHTQSTLAVYNDTGILRWWLGGTAGRRSVRHRAAHSVQVVGRFVSSPEFELLKTRITDLYHHRGVVPDRKMWAANSAHMLAGLEQFQIEQGDRLARAVLRYSLDGSSGIGNELLQRIREVALDLTLVKRRLRSYQEFGAKFALAVHHGLLGDEMGLGKTTQGLAAIGHAIAVEGMRHHLVICPASLLPNWVSEIKEVLVDIPTFVYHHHKHRERELGSWKSEGGILLSPYHLDPLVPHITERFGFLIIDEAHWFKNPTARRTVNVKKIRTMASRILLMTGTPLVNNENDVMNLVEIADERTAELLRHRFSSVGNIRHHADEFRHALSNIYLRRSERDVEVELPPLTLSDVPVELSSDEILVYKEAVRRGHLEGMRIAASSADVENWAKGDALEEILDSARKEGRKVLVFSQHVGTLERVERTVGAACFLIHGRISDAAQREREFVAHEGFAVMAGQIVKTGEGKNFQMASVVVLMEPQYTSVREAQAIKRAHRLGQTEHVVCHRLVAQGTIDEHLVRIVGLKAELINELVEVSRLAEMLDTHNRQPISDKELIALERKAHGFE